MGNLFNMDNGIFSFLGKVFDIIMLSIIWIICCIPIVTIGPATSAMYYTVVKVIRRNRGYISKEFFHSFKQNLKTGIGAGVIILVIGGLLLFNIQLSTHMTGKLSLVLGYSYRVFFVLLICVSIYVFPNLSRFDLKVLQLFKTSLIMAIKHLPSTIGMLLIVMLSVAITAITLIGVFFMPAVCLWIVSLLMERILKKYIPQSEEPKEGEFKKDEWYLE